VTLRAWLRERSPTPPPRLLARIESALGENCEGAQTDAPELCLSAAESLLRELVQRPTAGRESALDLLAVDALVTYAFEAAAEEPSTLAARADDAMSRLSSVAR
jgi:hypothetical protein